MIKKSIFGLLHLGECLRYLREREEGDLITHEKESEWKGTFVKGTINRFLKYLKEYDFSVAVRAADGLRGFSSKIKAKESGSTLTKEESDNLKETMRFLEKTIIAEAKGIHSFFTTDKKIPMEKLTAKQETLFPHGVFSELPEIAKYDVKEAGMCIAFERSTASAFHVLRATEDVLRNFYCRIVKRKRVDKLNWGNITNHLATRRKKTLGTIIKNLDYIRENFRNPTAHPEYRYDIERAQSLFNLCIDVISVMVKSPLWKKG